MQVMQGSDLAWLVVIIAVAAFLAGLCGERLRAKLARQAWQKREAVGEEVKEFPSRRVGEEVRERFPSRGKQLLSPTQQSSFA